MAFSASLVCRSGAAAPVKTKPAVLKPCLAGNPFHPTPGQARLRFAPSPTGYLHLGGLRTALFNHFCARKWQGKWVLRIEDTDQNRLVPGAVQALQDTLEWAGMDYDEGPGRGGSVGPYTQSERRDVYTQFVQNLVDDGHAYHCFCTPTELAEIRASQLAKKATSAYDNRCRHLTCEDVARRKKAGEKYVVRFKDDGRRFELGEVPQDLIFGDWSSSLNRIGQDEDHSKQSWNSPQAPTTSQLAPRTTSSEQAPPLKARASGARGPGAFVSSQQIADDFIILKSDGFPTYHLANVVDDHLMGITHVLRGEEWLPSTRKHHQLYKALGWDVPWFAHLPLLVNADGTKLSKRTGDVAVEDYKNKGYEPTALINFLALMGWDHHHHQTASGISSDSSRQTFFPSTSALAQVSTSPEELLQLRKDYNSYSELFTPAMLEHCFDLERVGRTRATVFIKKLDWINKMHLRRMAALDGTGKSRSQYTEGQEQGRQELLQRFRQALMRQEEIIKTPLAKEKVLNDEYLGQLVDLELARVATLDDLAQATRFFFVTPNLNNHEALSMFNDWIGGPRLNKTGRQQSKDQNSTKPSTSSTSAASTPSKSSLLTSSPQATKRYISVIETVLTLIRSTLRQAGPANIRWTEHDMHDLVALVKRSTGMEETGIKKVLRHALTGRKKGPFVPNVMAVLGWREVLRRLRRAKKWVVD